ncbi:MAG: glycosyltransferase family 2 protein [archaeon YNP-WB-062]|jgi:GT2 family glycosyltransferase|nr:glycosyltransferase family 2 protein [Candidatus Culexarchaeum yellowstonense]
MVLETNVFNNISVSVIILNWNGGKYLIECVDSVMKTDYPSDLLEVIIVDNGSTDGSAELAKKMYPQIKLIKNKRNLGFCIGNNIGIKNSSGDIIILLNNDTIVDKHWIKEILKCAQDPSVGIIGCRLYFPGTKIIQSLGFRMKFLGYYENIGAGQEDKGQFYEASCVDYVSGAALAVKRKVLDRIGLLDPMFYAYHEDADLCYRAKRAGYKVVTSNAIVYHYGSLSWNKFLIRRMYLSERNRIYFILKHFSPEKLLKFIFEYPIRSFKVNLCKYIKGETLLQKTATLSKTQGRWKISIVALTMEIIRLTMFFTALLSVATKGKR